MFLPNTLAPAKPYNAGKGEIGIRTMYVVPTGLDFKVGVTDAVQIAGIAMFPINSESGGGLYEGSMQINTSPAEHDKYLHIFGIGGGVNMVTYIKGSSQANYIYQGYYPGFALTDRVSISFPLRMYEYIGRYSCSQDQCPGNGARPLERYESAAFIPEMAWSADWTYVALRLGLSIPIQFWESANPATVVILPMFSAGLYGKW